MTDVYNVEAILDERYNRRKQRREWKVKWEGWDVKDCTWEPFEHMKTNLVWLEYRERKRKEDVTIKTSKRKRKEKADPRKKKKIGDEVYEEPLATPGRKAAKKPDKPKETVKRKLPVATFSDATAGLQLFNLPDLLDKVPDISFASKVVAKAAPEPAVEESKKSTKKPATATTIAPPTADVEKQLERLRLAIDTDSQLVKTCLNLTATIEGEDDLLSSDSTFVHQPLSAQIVMCQLVFAKMCSNIKVDYCNPPIIWAMSLDDERISVYYPRKGRSAPDCWLPTKLTFDYPLLPVSYQSFSGSAKEISLVIGLDLKSKAFVICCEEDGKYPAEQIASLSSEEIKDICAYSTLPTSLENWVQKRPTIEEKQFCEALGKDIAQYILDHSASLSVMGLKFRSEELEHLCDSD